MFHSAAIKLTLWYLGLIMFLSLCFSVIIYNISGNQLINNNRRQDYYLNDRLPQGNFNSFNRLRTQDVEDALHHLRSNLAWFNLLVLVAGGVASYALARRTLVPIEEALESQKRFTGDASHELRTPLTIMQAENEVALRNPNLTKAKAVEQLKSNLEEVAKLKALSDGLLKLATIDYAAVSLGPVSATTVARDVLKRWQPAALEKSIKLENQVTDLKILGEKESLVELISILVDNAIKYSSPGSHVVLSSQLEGKMVALEVSDEGEGIDPEYLPKIFDRFFRADSSRSTANGYGLGLSIAQRIVELHKGSIEVKTTANEGSTFTVHLHPA